MDTSTAPTLPAVPAVQASGFYLAPRLGDRDRPDLATTYVAPSLELALALARATHPGATVWTFLGVSR